MESEELNIYTKNYFKTSYNKEDVSKLPLFKQWLSFQEKEGKKVVRCPICWGYEVFVRPSNYECTMCNNEYCQKCLKPCVEGEVIHDHERGCCSKFKGLIDIMVDWGDRAAKNENVPACELVEACLTFVFGNHILYTIKYFKYFNQNKIIDNECTHGFFKYMNLFANSFYCLIYYIAFFEFFFFLFFPAIFIRCYFRFIAYNWLIVLEFDVDESPVTELTVRGRGYSMY